MAEIVLVHGIAQEQESADTLEAVWVPAIAGGVRSAGYPQLADRLWRQGRFGEGGVSVRMAAYGDLFLQAGVMGGDEENLDDLDPEQRHLAAILAGEWISRAAERPGHPDQNAAATELAYLEPGHEEMGRREEAARMMLTGAARLRWFAPIGMAFAQRFVNKSLRQVTGYLTDQALRDEIQQRVRRVIGSDTCIIIGHSLGSIIAYEATFGLRDPLPVLITLGSPIGLRTIVYDRLIPQPPTFPAKVKRWVNIADRDDLVAAVPDLESLFGTSKPGDATLECDWTIDNGASPHGAQFYLSKKQVGLVVAAAFPTSEQGQNLDEQH